MKRTLTGAEYSFDASAQQVTIIGFTPAKKNIKVITNVTDNIIIYSSTTTTKKGTLSGQVLTLQYDTTTMDDTDELQIEYWDASFVQPVSATALPLAPDAATQTTLAAVLAKITADPATQTTLAALLAKVIAAPSTEAKQDAMITLLTTISGLLAGTLTVSGTVGVSSLPAGLATSANQSSEITLLNSIATLLAATLTISGTVTANAGTNLNTSALALEATLQSVKTAVETIDNFISGSKGLVTEDNSAAILAKIIAAPATEAKQDTIIGHVDGIETALSTLNGKDFATQTTLAAILAKIIAAPATEAKQDTMITSLSVLDDWDESDRAKVNLIAGQAGIDGNSGNKSAATPRVVIATDQPNFTTDINVKLIPQTSGGLSIFRSIDLDETEEDVKTSAGQLFGWYLFNNHATNVLFVKIYNATAANVTVGSTTPVMTIPLPPKSGANALFETGIAFSTAISAAATTGVADNDTGTPGANEVIANFFYK